jgi:hypothetical protein
MEMCELNTGMVKVKFEEWYKWFVNMQNRQEDDSEKNAIKQLTENVIFSERERIIGIVNQFTDSADYAKSLRVLINSNFKVLEEEK